MSIKIGTKIFTDHGWKPIEDIKVGDMVGTHRARFMPVTKAVSVGNRYAMFVATKNSGYLGCTMDHPIITKRKARGDMFIKIGSELTLNDLLGYGINKDKLTARVVWKPVRIVHQSHNIKKMYDIEVDVDHTFSANGIFVHD